MNLDDYLHKISYNSNVKNLDELYSKMSSSLDLRTEIGYTREKEHYITPQGENKTEGRYYLGLFYLSLSVKVFTNSLFIPFRFILSNCSNNVNEYVEDTVFEEGVNKGIVDIVNSHKIGYSYVDFFREVKEKNDRVSSIDIKYDIKNDKIEEIALRGEDQSEIISETSNSEKPQESSSNRENLKGFNSVVCNKLLKEDGFVKQLASLFERKDRTYYFSIFAFDSDSEQPNEKLTHFLLVSNDKDENQAFFYNRIRRIRDIASRIRTKHMQNLMEKIRYEATKSAKSAIMSRNMSHNLGSHVMAYLKHHLGSAMNILQDNVLSDFVSAESYSELKRSVEEARAANDSSVTFTKEVSTDEGSLSLPFLVGLGHFISYLQERQDFIATISTDYIPYFSTVNFKDSIYDVLNLDKKHLRHKNKNNMCLKPDNILLGNIARSEGLGRSISPTEKLSGKLSDIIIKFRKFDGNPVVEKTNKDAFDSLEFMRKIDVSLPGGMVGRQAIFSIVENIIRNAAKHGNWRSEGSLELTFDFIDLESILNEEEPHEKRSEAEEQLSLKEVLRFFYSQAIDKDDLYFFTITDNVKTSLEAVHKLSEALHDDYIEDNGVMKDGNKGIKELRISAAWLRGGQDESGYYSPSSTERVSGPPNKEPQTNKKAPLVYVRQSHGHLQYIFCLLIPKRVAIVSEKFDKECLNANAKKCLADSYWKAFTPSRYIEENNKSYNFVLCDGPDCYNKVRTYSSSKIVEIDGMGDNVKGDQLFKCIRDGITQEECTRIELCMYRYFSKCIMENDNIQDFICIDDKRTFAKYRDNSTTYEWQSSSEDKKTGYYTKDGEKVYANKDGLYDGLGLISPFSYCRVGNILITDGGGFGRYVYRTHHDTDVEFDRFMNELRDSYAGCQFVESVTGNSSTDRLVRNVLFDDKWFFSHLRAMKQKVAICDERLFAKIYGLEEVDFTRANAAQGPLEEMKKAYIEMFGMRYGPKFKNDMNNCKSIDEVNKMISNIKSLSMQLYKNEVAAKYKSASVYYQKGICIFTFVRNPDGRTYGMYGLCINSERTDVLDAIDSANNAQIKKLVDLSWKNDSLEINEYQGGEYLSQGFDYISIHQGLLDKLYEAFNIKDNVKAKNELTRKLYQLLKRGMGPFEETQTFMPGLSIHSGRSKPNKSDMPQWVPFIQYASIEHATLDCKYSLVELLDNARYE